MPEVEVDDPLTKNTARLSISAVDVENENPRLQFAEILKSTNHEIRRDSAVSLTSLNKDEDLDTPLSGINGDGEENSNLNENLFRRPKRRRSSAQSISSLSKNPKSPTKKEKSHKKKLKKSKQLPNLELVTDLTPTKKFPTNNKKLSLTNFRDLILHIFNRNTQPNWIKVTKPEEIKSLVFCFIPGLVYDDFIKNPDIDKDSKFVSMNDSEKIDDLSFFYENFEYILPTTAPGSKESIFSSLHTLINVPLTKKEKKDIFEESKKIKLTLWDILLTEEQMIQNNYPVTIDPYDPEWVETKMFDHEGSRTFALDCEFCQSANGKVLTRISLINFQNDVLIDTLVKPKEEITDYLTKYSGITENKLKNVTTTLKEVQEKILSIVSSDDILIGHSLESDLNVMKIKHSRIIDTAIVYEHHRGPPSKPSLKWLTEKYLKRVIQAGESNGEGHSSIEDSKACLDLIKLKLQEGKYFGVNVNEISLFDRLNKNSKESIKSFLIDYTPLRDWSNEQSGNVKKVKVNNDDEVVQLLSDEINHTELIILKLRELEFNLDWSPIPKHYNGYLNEDQNDKSIIYKKLNDRLNKIYDALPENTALIICSSSGDPKEMIQLQSIRKKFQSLEREGKDVTKLPKEQSWDFDKLSELHNATTKARQAISFISLKQTSS